MKNLRTLKQLLMSNFRYIDKDITRSKGVYYYWHVAQSGETKLLFSDKNASIVEYYILNN